MDFFKQWCFCVCVTLAAAVIFSLLTPRGSMKRFYKILVSLFIFASFLYPFSGFRLSHLKTENPFAGIRVQAQTDPYNALVEREVRSVLQQQGVIGADVSAVTEVDYESGEIRIIAVQVSVPDEVDKEKVRQQILEAVGIQARVIHIGE